MPNLPILIDKFNQNPMKISTRFFVDINNIVLKFLRKSRGSRLVKLLRKNKVREMATWLRIYYLDTHIKTMWYWWKFGHRWRNRIKIYEFFYKGAKQQLIAGNTTFSTNVAGTFLYPKMK